MTYNQFVTKWNGRYCEFNNDQYKFQCLDLVWQYMQEVLNIDPTPYRGWGTAKNVFYSSSKIKDFDKNFVKVYNTPTNVPQKGDILFFKTSVWFPYLYGSAGHTAIFSEGNVKGLVSFDQNYPTKSFCRYVNHTYKDCLGWFHKK